jgi:hypothetical protein
MFDIKQVKHMLVHGGLAVSDAVKDRILNDRMTEDDHKRLSNLFGIMRNINK